MKLSAWLVSQTLGYFSSFLETQKQPLLHVASPRLPLSVRLVYQFPNPTYLQSLYVRANGQLLVTTVFPNASIYCVTDPETDSPQTSLLYMAPTSMINVITNIIETEPDVLVFLGGNQSNLGIGIPGTFGVFEIDLRRASDDGDPPVRELVRIDQGGLIVGVERTPASATRLLVSDSSVGVIWHVDTIAETYSLAISDPNMASPVWSPIHFGVNCLRILNGYLYWTLSFEAAVYRLPITEQGSRVTGMKSELYAQVHSQYFDNFVFGPRHRDVLWGATAADNRLAAIEPDGTVTFVAGEPDEMTLAGATAPFFGTAVGDTDTLYVATSGGMLFPINGTVVEGAKIVAIDTRGYFSGPTCDQCAASGKT